MDKVGKLLVILAWLPVSAFCQDHHHAKNTEMDTHQIQHPVARQAIEALQSKDEKKWLALFSDSPELYDDGNKMDFFSFFKDSWGEDYFLSIDKVERGGLDVYGKFHTGKWGDFKTYFKFKLDASGKIQRLDVGQARY